MSNELRCTECGDMIAEHYNCQQVAAERLRLVQELLKDTEAVVAKSKGYIDQLEIAFTDTLRCAAEIFEAMLPDIERLAPHEKYKLVDAIAAINQTIADHEKEKGYRNETID